MISKLQFNLKFNHPSNISFFNLTQIVFLLFSLNIIVKLAVRFHIIFWSKLLHRLFQIYSCICVYLVLYLYFQLKYLLFQNCTWQLSLWRCTLRCCVRIQIYCCICIYLFLCLYFQVRFLLFRNCTWQLALWRCTLMRWSCVSNQAAASAAPNLLLSSSCCNTIYRKFAKRQIRKRPTNTGVTFPSHWTLS